MAKNELITMQAISIAESIQFKDARLKAATDKIVAIYHGAVEYADKKNREIAQILSKVKTERSYEVDGFKSVADYAYQVFDLNKSNSYALASAGDVYNDKGASPELKQFSTSKLAAIASVPREKIEADVKAGVISASTSQGELKDYATKNAPKKADKVHVLTMYKAVVNGGMEAPFELCRNAEAELDTFFGQTMTLPEWEEDIPKALYLHLGGEWEGVKLAKAPLTLPNGEKAAKATVNRRVYVCRENAPVYVEFTEVSAKPEKLAGAKTREEMLALLQSMDAADIEAILATVKGASK